MPEEPKDPFANIIKIIRESNFKNTSEKKPGSDAAPARVNKPQKESDTSFVARVKSAMPHAAKLDSILRIADPEQVKQVYDVALDLLTGRTAKVREVWGGESFIKTVRIFNVDDLVAYGVADSNNRDNWQDSVNKGLLHDAIYNAGIIVRLTDQNTGRLKVPNVFSAFNVRSSVTNDSNYQLNTIAMRAEVNAHYGRGDVPFNTASDGFVFLPKCEVNVITDDKKREDLKLAPDTVLFSKSSDVGENRDWDNSNGTIFIGNRSALSGNPRIGNVLMKAVIVFKKEEFIRREREQGYVVDDSDPALRNIARLEKNEMREIRTH